MSFGSTTLGSGASGACGGGTGVTFTGSGQSASAPVSDPGYSGVISVLLLKPSVATGSYANGVLTVTSGSVGTASVTAVDTNGHSVTCSVTVSAAGSSDHLRAAGGTP